MKKTMLPLAMFSLLMITLGANAPAMAQDMTSDQVMKQNSAPQAGNLNNKNNPDVAASDSDNDFDSDVDEFTTADNATGDDDF